MDKIGYNRGACKLISAKIPGIVHIQKTMKGGKNMADIDFMDISAADIVERLVTGVEEQLGEPLYPGDERRLFCEALAPVIVGVINMANDSSKQRLLRYARKLTDWRQRRPERRYGLAWQRQETEALLFRREPGQHRTGHAILPRQRR